MAWAPLLIRSGGETVPGAEDSRQRKILPASGGSGCRRRRLDNPVAVLDEGDNWLMLYRSQDAHGIPVATSGIIALPRTDPPAGGFPVISWAHGTTGVADGCAPSRDQPTSQAHPMNVYVHTLLNTFFREGSTPNSRP